MAAVYVPTPRFGDDSLTDFHHGLLAEVPLEGADISSIHYCRTGAASLSPEAAMSRAQRRA